MQIFIICLLNVIVSAEGLPWRVEIPVKGRLIAKSDNMYLIDFTHDIKRMQLFGNPEEYKAELIRPLKCEKL